jgi:hypothetical protein
VSIVGVAPCTDWLQRSSGIQRSAPMPFPNVPGTNGWSRCAIAVLTRAIRVYCTVLYRVRSRTWLRTQMRTDHVVACDAVKALVRTVFSEWDAATAAATAPREEIIRKQTLQIRELQDRVRDAVRPVELEAPIHPWLSVLELTFPALPPGNGKRHCGEARTCNGG